MDVRKDAGLQQIDGLVAQHQHRQKQRRRDNDAHVLLHHAAVRNPLDHQGLQKADHRGQHQRQPHHHKGLFVGQQVAEGSTYQVIFFHLGLPLWLM